MLTSPLSWNTQKILNYSLEHSVADGAEIPEEICPTDQQILAHRELLDAGLVLKDDRLSGGALFDLNAEGQATARQLSRGFRRRALQQAVLEAVAEGDMGSTMEVALGCGDADNEKAGLEAASEALKEWKLIDGIGAWSGPGVIRPTITNLGHQCLESGYAPQDFVHRGAADQHRNIHAGDTNFYGTVGAAQWGDYNTAHVDQRHGADLDQVLAFLTAVRDVTSRHRDDNAQGAAALTQQAALIEEDARDSRWERVSVAVNALISTATVAFGSEVGRQLAGHVPAFLGALS